MAKQFRDLKSLQKFVENNLPKTILGDGLVENELRKTMIQSVQTVVYDYYLPEKYKRRGNDGGLADGRLMKITEAILVNGKFSIVFENLAEGNDGLKGQQLVDTIEEGIQENWSNPNGKWSDPRPFVRDTFEQIVSNPKPLIEAVKKAFVANGFTVR